MRKTHHPVKDPRPIYYYGEWESDKLYSTFYHVPMVSYNGDYYILNKKGLSYHGVTSKNPEESSVWDNYTKKISNIKTDRLENGPVFLNKEIQLG